MKHYHGTWIIKHKDHLAEHGTWDMDHKTQKS
jgi:hypothetical protein